MLNNQAVFQPRFAEVVRELLQGGVICPHRTLDMFKYLEVKENREAVDDHLFALGLKTAATQEGEAYYAAYAQLDTSQARQSVNRTFTSFVVDLEGMVNWLRFYRGITDMGRPLCAGDEVRESEMLAYIEDSSSSLKQLEDIAIQLKVGGKSAEPKVRLSNILRDLVKRDLLVPVGSTGSVYIATAKWTLVYEVLDFIHERDGLALSEPEEPEQNQERLF